MTTRTILSWTTSFLLLLCCVWSAVRVNGFSTTHHNNIPTTTSNTAVRGVSPVSSIVSWRTSQKNNLRRQSPPNAPYRASFSVMDTTALASSSNNNDDNLSETSGGYTIKQRLREEVESPFRKVRFIFWLTTVGSAAIALYFSGMSTVKSMMGGYVDAPPIQDALSA